ncbi:alpha/beta hydrolase family protein [Pseudonocardia phyllosphaerae]|uniref:alpha/beta hydrolase family protein n=1 Tax=Pseudonocardia phyllosphaerae TaxID=3390502 RepID=UPI0039789675
MSAVPHRAGPDPQRTTGYGDDPDQVVEWWTGGATGRPTVALVHGGYWRPRFDRTHLRPAAEALHALGFPVASLEYRRTPGDPHASASDVVAGLRAVAAGAGPAGVIAVGHSAGGHLALLAAVTEPGLVRTTVALAPVADVGLCDRLGLGESAAQEYLGGPASAHPDLDPALLPAPAGPVTILHGDRDDRVPFEVSESYVRQRPGPRLVGLPGADHFAPVDPWSGAWADVVAELRRVTG